MALTLRSRRRQIPVAIALVVIAIWGIVVTWFGYWPNVFSHWYMSLTMALGSFIAGASSEGGGAVAFPVMTLGFGIQPSVARDFSLLIQSVGMSAAAITIFAKKIKVEMPAVIFASIGGIFGILVGLVFLAPILAPAMVKMFFLSLWVSFGFAVFLVKKHRHGKIFHRRAGANPRHLIIVGFVGGMVSGLLGSGLDLLTFAFISLVYGVTERVATPTSVVIMAFNAIFGSFVNITFLSIEPIVWDYWLACVPVVVIGAPVGALFIANKSNDFILLILLSSIATQYACGLLIIPLNSVLVVTSLLTISIGVLGFSGLARYGNKLQGCREKNDGELAA